MSKAERKELTTLLILFLFFTIGVWFFMSGCQKVVVISQSDDIETADEFSVDNDSGFIKDRKPEKPTDFSKGMK